MYRLIQAVLIDRLSSGELRSPRALRRAAKRRLFEAPVPGSRPRDSSQQDDVGLGHN